MQPIDLITLKRDGKTLNAQQIKAFVHGVCDDSWPDYQQAAMLMAMFIRGLNATETTELTLAMAESGHQLDLSSLSGTKVDKHSTGGVADTTTLVLLPLIASCGIPMVKMSGRGLGFTGGTIDKLESIPGFRTDLSESQALRQARQHGMAILSQTGDLTPADRKLYALRDVTATVDSIPLIAASIMSKKLAAGADAIILDVKCGSGAFMQDEASARALAERMVAIGQAAGRKTRAVISRMDQPLGDHVGNALEVMEAIDVLQGKPGDLRQLVLTLGAHLLQMSGQETSLAKARAYLAAKLDGGKALAKMRQLIQLQGGNPAVIDDPKLFSQAPYQENYNAFSSGYLASIDTAAIGQAFIAAGGGRRKKDDVIDPGAGFILQKRLGDRVNAGDTILKIHCQNESLAKEAGKLLSSAFRLEKSPPPRQDVLLAVID